MQEDKTSKRLAAELRKQQERNPLPYELGAWEAFDKKRIDRARKTHTYWLTGIAASLALLVLAGGLWLSGNTDLTQNSSLSDQFDLKENAGISDSNSNEETIEIVEESGQIDSPVLESSEKTGPKNPTLNSGMNSSSVISLKPVPNKFPIESRPNPIEKPAVIDRKVAEESGLMADPIQDQIALQNEIGVKSAKIEVPDKVIATLDLPKEHLLS